ncbi:MAG: hypothetical protein HXY42_13485, partial [Chloroflexi bacterium]|nr:hypothetical protein [Chloroflexota bacterium]
MNTTIHKGLRVTLLLTLLLASLGIDKVRTVYAAPPSHDNFVNARLIDSITYVDLNVNTSEATPRFNPITEEVVAPGDGADLDNVGPCESNIFLNTGSNTVWYKYTPPVNESIAVDTNGSDYDTFIAVWTGSPGSLNLVGCNDDNYFGDSEFSFSAAQGITYYIQVGEFNGFEGNAFGGSTGGTLQFHAYITNLDVTIGTNPPTRYYMESGQSKVETYLGVNGGPVVVKSTNGANIIASYLQYRRPGTTGGWTGIT